MFFLGFDNYIINISLDKAVFYLVVEAGLYSALVGSSGVFEPERHSRVAVGAKRRDERCFDLVILFQGYLVIAGVTIEEGEQFVANSGVYNLVYPRQTEGVFRAVFVEIGVINAHSPFFILFSHKN